MSQNHVASDQREAIRTVVKGYRDRQGMQQNELSRRIGVDHTQLSRWESGSRTPGLMLFRRFLRHSGMSGDEIRHALAAVFGLDPETMEPIPLPRRKETR